MKVNNVNSNNYSSPNFSGIRQYSAKLPLIGKKDTLLCYVSKLTREDVPYFQKYQGLWSSNEFLTVRNFLKKARLKCEGKKLGNLEKTEFYMIEQPAEQDPKKIVKAIAQITQKPDSMRLDFLQSARCRNQKTNVSGAGSVMVYVLSQLENSDNYRCCNACYALYREIDREQYV